VKASLPLHKSSTEAPSKHKRSAHKSKEKRP